MNKIWCKLRFSIRNIIKIILIFLTNITKTEVEVDTSRTPKTNHYNKKVRVVVFCSRQAYSSRPTPLQRLSRKKKPSRSALELRSAKEFAFRRLADGYIPRSFRSGINADKILLKISHYIQTLIISSMFERKTEFKITNPSLNSFS